MVLDLHGLVLALVALVLGLHGLVLAFHAVVPDLLTREEPRSQAVKAPPHLRTSRAAFVFEARRTADLVEQNVERLSAATNGKINAKTANEMRELADRLTQLHGAEYRYGSARPAIQEAIRWIRLIRRAAATVALDQPVAAEQLQKSAPSQSRSIAQVVLDFESHIALFDTHRAQLGPMFPADVDDQLARVHVRLLDQSSNRERAGSRRAERRAELRTIEQRLNDLVRTSRAVLHVIKHSAA